MKKILYLLLRFRNFLSCIFLLSILLFIPGFCDAQNQQANETIYRDWQMLSESPTMIDVSYRIVKCSEGFNQIHLFIFNENSKDQKAHFTLKITNIADKKSIDKVIDFSMSKGDIRRAKCDSPAELNALKIDLPQDYDPRNISITITY